MRSFIILALSALALSNISLAQVGFDDVRPSLVIITTDEGRGSGFIVLLDGQKYILTNRHVVQGATKLTFKLVDGTEISPLRAEIADTQDLMRFAIDEKYTLTALLLAEAPPTLDQPITVYGDSEGQGAITRLEGKILGIGPGVIEVNAGFVLGNSGSPILSRGGKVLGVATYVTKNAPASDWITSGTRFQAARRFGIQIHNGMSWTPISWKGFTSQVSLLAEADSFCDDLYNIVGCWRGYPNTKSRRDIFMEYLKTRKQIRTQRWGEELDLFVGKYAEYWLAVDKYSERSVSLTNARMALKGSFQALPNSPLRTLKSMKWAGSMAQEADMRIELLSLFAEEVQKTLDSADFWREPIIYVPYLRYMDWH